MAQAHATAIDGIVLAAGQSSRMGQPKAELELAGRTFLDRCIDALLAGGCRSVVVVLGRPAGAARAARAGARADIVTTLNPDPESQPIDSIRIGLEALPGDSAGAAVLPVDAPAVRADTVRRLIDAFHAAPGNSGLIVRPVHAGVAGHPTIFARPLFQELRSAGLPRGAESVVTAHAADCVDVAVHDPGVVANVNTPGDYERLVEGA